MQIAECLLLNYPDKTIHKLIIFDLRNLDSKICQTYLFLRLHNGKTYYQFPYFPNKRLHDFFCETENSIIKHFSFCMPIIIFNIFVGRSKSLGRSERVLNRKSGQFQ